MLGLSLTDIDRGVGRITCIIFHWTFFIGLFSFESVEGIPIQDGLLKYIMRIQASLFVPPLFMILRLFLVVAEYIDPIRCDNKKIA